METTLAGIITAELHLDPVNWHRCSEDNIGPLCSHGNRGPRDMIGGTEN